MTDIDRWFLWALAMPKWPVPFSGETLEHYKDVTLVFHKQDMDDWLSREPIEVSFKGRTSGFDPLNEGSSPSASAN